MLETRIEMKLINKYMIKCIRLVINKNLYFTGIRLDEIENLGLESWGPD